ncbi:hypothetical protein [Agrococcus sp. ARC_14]|uniref:hypothetical protein n=1 Tax=Agrococcus sp. ARC_14 TaxID=2919927 RepID=UPI001F067117|nr:hypothetical protein [Agrococcus sp. ARC_14]MCH1881983.1 hypothetical protein [Agrococcus sp. ARC_14]
MTHPQPTPDAGAQYASPAQHAPQAQHAQVHYAPHSPQQPAGKPGGRGKPLAIVALVLAGLGTVAGASIGFVTFGFVREGGNYNVVGVIGAVGAVVSGLLALGALGFGIASLLRREPARVLAGVAIGISIAGLLGLLLSGAQQLLYLTL